MAETSLRKRLYREFARVGAALANDKRLELIDLLAQAPRNVAALAAEVGIPMASVSQHLQVLRNAKMVEADRQGNKVVYRLADPLVLRLWLTLRAMAERRLPDVEQMVRESNGAATPGLTHDELQALMVAGKLFLIDVRPRLEYDHGHLPGAASFPVDELPQRLTELPRETRIVTYCRGIYCAMSGDAEALLRANGFEVSRLEGGWPEWWDEGRPAETR